MYFSAGPDWSRNPQGLGQNSNFGSNVDRHKTKGSPVVPGSLVTVTSDNDSTLFMITILKGMYEVSFRLFGSPDDMHCNYDCTNHEL